METSKTLETNKKIARQTFEAFEKKDFALLDKITDQKKFKLHFPGNPQPLNFEEAKKLNAEYNSAFPDMKIAINLQIAEGEYVVSRVTYHGINKGSLRGIPASHKKVSVTATAIQRIVDGKVVEEWDEFDELGMLHQIGAVPELSEQSR